MFREVWTIGIYNSRNLYKVLNNIIELINFVSTIVEIYIRY